MKVYKRSFFSIYLYLFFILLFILFFYFFNPFRNECIQGNCENGSGVYFYHSGMKYDGEWNNGRRDGQGTLTYADGSQYTGGWKNDRMHGQGIKIYSSDHLFRKYIGEWKNGNKNGKGTAVYTGGSRYEGHWKDGQTHGHGTMITIDERKITGQWTNGEISGTAIEVYPDGKIAVAEWKNSKKNGPGTLTYPDGTVITGQWINNKLVGSLGYYLFRGIEFEKQFNLEALCSAIKADISFSLNAQDNTIAWLNELLKTTDLYDTFHRKVQLGKLPRKINTLIKATKNERSREFSELSGDNQKNIVKLNRLLLEYLYSNKTPKAE